MEELTVFLRKNRSNEPQNSMHADTSATSALSNVAFIAFRRLTCDYADKLNGHPAY